MLLQDCDVACGVLWEYSREAVGHAAYPESSCRRLLPAMMPKFSHHPIRFSPIIRTHGYLNHPAER